MTCLPKGTRRPRTVLPRRLAAAVFALVMTIPLGCSTTGGSARSAPTSEPAKSSSVPDPSRHSTDGHALKAGPPIRIVAVGDVACPPGKPPTPRTCQQEATAKLTASLNPSAVLMLGDLQYERASAEEFSSFDDSWGGLLPLVLPVPGNHEYKTSGARGYQDYMARSVKPYAVRLGTWRVFFLDTNCAVADCAAGATWLADKIARTPQGCTAVAWHHPRFSSGPHGDQPQVDPLWRVAAKGGVDLLIVGHDHLYERLSPMDARGVEVSHGLRQFTVGTGGHSLYAIKRDLAATQYIQNDHFGVLELTLHRHSYAWQFISISGEVLDAGAHQCSR